MNEPVARWLSAAEAAAYLSISRTSFLNLVKSGEMPEPARPGVRMVRYDKQKIDEYMERSNENGTGNSTG